MNERKLIWVEEDSEDQAPVSVPPQGDISNLSNLPNPHRHESIFVHSLFDVRSFSVQFPFNCRSITIQSPFNQDR
jgi:hypothetical protein